MFALWHCTLKSMQWRCRLVSNLEAVGPGWGWWGVSLPKGARRTACRSRRLWTAALVRTPAAGDLGPRRLRNGDHRLWWRHATGGLRSSHST